ncbi:MAG: T9SS type A sorting domain-containing protein [Ignavibacterium sp.]|nr:T9SS type A sorting domain-containing protein [Ignavibacterium sp.]
MRIKILIIVSAMTYCSFSQTIYEVTPGTKGNEIVLTVANISKTNPTGNVNVSLAKKSSSLNFSKEEATIENLEAKAEANVSFVFDVNRSVEINRKDTIEFTITSLEGIMMMKQFIFSYTGPKEFKLEQNYPNPFNPTTKIRYSIPNVTLRQAQGDNMTTLKVYDILGNEVATLVNEQKEAGYYEVEFSASSFASGVYVYRLQSGSFVSSKKMMVIK